MRKFLLTPILAAALLLGAVIAIDNPRNGHAQVADNIPCFGTDAAYRAQFDHVDGTLDNEVSYPEPRAFIESQSHLKDPLAPPTTPRAEFEHLHLGACYPYAETWVQPSNARTIDVRYVFNHVEHYNIVTASGTFVDKTNSGGGYTATVAQKTALEASMDASADSTQTIYQSYNLANIGTSCRKSFRPTLNTVRSSPEALVDEWQDAGQWTSYINYAGQPVCTPEFAVDQLRSRSWTQPNGGYIYTTLFGLPTASQMAEPVIGSLDFTVGVSGRPFSVHVDPNYHGHEDNHGIWHQDYPGTNGVVTDVSIPMEGIPAGVHRVVVISGGGVQQSIQVFPFKKAGTC